MSKGLILYFDYWTVGIKNFKFFDDQLKSEGYETKLLHLNSWRKIPGPTNQVIDGIACFDIRYYNTNCLHKVLEIEKPLAVILLNLSFITDRSVILSCKQLDIKSIYLMHGALVREEYIEDTANIINEKLKWLKFKRGLRHLSSTVINYIYSLSKFNSRCLLHPHPYSVLYQTFVNPGKFLHFPPAAFDLEPDLSLVYGLEDKAFYIKRSKLPETSVKVVGNPELDQFFRTLDQLEGNKTAFLLSHNIPGDKPYVTYIEEGLVEDRMWSNEYRLHFLSEISDACATNGRHLVVKLHPRTAAGPNYESFLHLPNTTVLSSVDFAQLIYHTEKCISHYSTTLIYPMLLDKPILVPRWGQSEKILTLYSSKEVTFVYTTDDLRKLITTTSFNYDRSEYLNNIVPFRDGKTAKRITNHILACVK